jgi:hypothetical protein
MQVHRAVKSIHSLQSFNTEISVRGCHDFSGDSTCQTGELCSKIYCVPQIYCNDYVHHNTCMFGIFLNLHKIWLKTSSFRKFRFRVKYLWIIPILSIENFLALWTDSFVTEMISNTFTFYFHRRWNINLRILHLELHYY